MATKERYQNPAISDTIKLRLFTYNSNNLADVTEIESVKIYHLDRNEISEDNPDGRTLIETIEGTAVTTEDTGTYLCEVELAELQYSIGDYIDVWTISVSEDMPSQTVEQVFKVYPSLWYTTPIPIVFDFKFLFQPNKFRKGSKQYLIIEIVPNVPTAGDLRAYYENLAIVSDLKISIEQACGDCLPEEEDLRLVIDEESVDYREKRFGYYQLDTEDMDCGLYNIWFKLEIGGNTYLSDKYKLQIYD